MPLPPLKALIFERVVAPPLVFIDPEAFPGTVQVVATSGPSTTLSPLTEGIS